MSQKFSRSAFLAVMVLFSAFSGVLTFELMQEDPRPCGCTTTKHLENASNTVKILAFNLCQNILVIAASGWVMYHLTRKGMPPAAPSERPSGQKQEGATG